MNNQDTMSIRTNVKLDAHLFNHDHSPDTPTTASEFERRLSHWIETNNDGAKAICELKHGPSAGVYVVIVALENDHAPLAWSANGRTKFAVVTINGQAMTDDDVELVMKLRGVDLSRLDDIVF
jgi:hypothetical protein